MLRVLPTYKNQGMKPYLQNLAILSHTLRIKEETRIILVFTLPLL